MGQLRVSGDRCDVRLHKYTRGTWNPNLSTYGVAVVLARESGNVFFVPLLHTDPARPLASGLLQASTVSKNRRGPMLRPVTMRTVVGLAAVTVMKCRTIAAFFRPTALRSTLRHVSARHAHTSSSVSSIAIIPTKSDAARSR